jgi:NAD(P)-dependent dehydrogenase (short-subunit alcohol dehydrogenase family)
MTELTASVAHGEAQPGEIHAVGYGCDVSSEQSVKETFAKIESEFGGRIDVSSSDPHRGAN